MIFKLLISLIYNFINLKIYLFTIVQHFLILSRLNHLDTLKKNNSYIIDIIGEI